MPVHYFCVMRVPDGPAWNVSDVAAALGVTSRAIEHLKKRFVEEGLEAALDVSQGKSLHGKSPLMEHLKPD